MATANIKIEIVNDTNAESPREWDNRGVMVCAHGRYQLGDKDGKAKALEFIRSRISEEKLEKMEFNEDHVPSIEQALLLTGKVLLLPLYLYDHSGITISTSPFSCSWDSGKVGFIFVTHQKMLEEYGGDWVSAETLRRATACLRGEVEVYDQYLTGDIWGFRVLDSDGEEVDSCWGFFGRDPLKNGIAEHMSDEAKALLEAGQYQRL